MVIYESIVAMQWLPPKVLSHADADTEKMDRHNVALPAYSRAHSCHTMNKAVHCCGEKPQRRERIALGIDEVPSKPVYL